METSDKFPIDWNEWNALWHEWADEQLRLRHFKHVDPRVVTLPKHKNMLADAVLDYWEINGLIVELSDVTMPDFSDRYGGDRSRRYVGITYFDKDGNMVGNGNVVDTFDELAAELYG